MSQAFDPDKCQVNQVLRTNQPSIGHIFEHVSVLEQYQRHLRSLLQPGVAEHCICANLRAQRLIVFLPDASVATRVRFGSQALTQALNRQLPPELPRVTDIIFKVRPPQALAREPKPKRHGEPHRISPTAKQHLEEVAENLPHPGLARALQRLAK